MLHVSCLPVISVILGAFKIGYLQKLTLCVISTDLAYQACLASLAFQVLQAWWLV
jgi:hypothetical protein